MSVSTSWDRTVLYFHLSRLHKEYMIRAVYAEMLGHDASFAYIHAVKLTHEKNLFAKRSGHATLQYEDDLLFISILWIISPARICFWILVLESFRIGHVLLQVHLLMPWLPESLVITGPLSLQSQSGWVKSQIGCAFSPSLCQRGKGIVGHHSATSNRCR